MGRFCLFLYRFWIYSFKYVGYLVVGILVELELVWEVNWGLGKYFYICFNDGSNFFCDGDLELGC